jgi:hypothetical protein
MTNHESLNNIGIFISDTNNIRQEQLLACHTPQSQSRSCYYSLGVDGREWDVSNLSSRPRPTTSPSTACRQFKRLSKDYTALYPSRYLVKDIPDVHVNSIFEDGGCQEQQAGPASSCEQQSSTYHEGGLLIRFSEQHNKPSRKLDFQDDFTCISQMPSTGTMIENKETRSRQDENSVSNPAGEHHQVAQEELKKPPPPAAPKILEIEVSPGYYLMIRGAAETNLAIQQGRVRPTVCSCCTSQLYCIMVAEYVLCPTCREISPVDFKDNNSLLGRAGGVGLGLTRESLCKLRKK